MLTQLHAGGKFGGGGYKVSGGLHGVGSSVVNALSTRLDVEVRQKGHVFRMTFDRRRARRRRCEQTEATDETGTTITFWANADIFETVDFDFETLRGPVPADGVPQQGPDHHPGRRAARASADDERRHRPRRRRRGGRASRPPRSTRPPRRRRRKTTAKRVSYRYDDGLVDYVKHLIGSKRTEPVHPESSRSRSRTPSAQLVARARDAVDHAYTESVHTYANTINTHEGGTHEEGFRAALTKLVNDFARKQNLLKEKDENLTGDDVREGLTAVISVKLGEPQFEGQTKTKLGNSEVKGFVQRAMTDELGDWLERPPAARASDIVRKSIQAAAARMAARKAREATRRKGLLESRRPARQAQGLPEQGPGRSPRSSSSRATRPAARPCAGRNPHTQAILPIRGKILNVEQARIDKVLANNEVQALISAFGTGIGEDFDLEQGALPQDRADGRRRRRRHAHPHAAADAALPVHAPAHRGRLRLPRPAAALPAASGATRAHEFAYSDRERDAPDRRPAQEPGLAAAQGRPDPALQGPRRDGLPGAVGDHDGPRPRGRCCRSPSTTPPRPTRSSPILMGEDVESPPLVHPAQRPRRPLPRHLSRGRRARCRSVTVAGERAPANVHARDEPNGTTGLRRRAAADRDRPHRADRPQHRDAAVSYIDYAMCVIVSRALPDVRDGLKPVHRRVLYAMYDGGYRPDRGFNKCARVVGEVMGQYHPHGDAAIYDALVRLVQDWSLRYPLVDGQGNFGSPGDDPAAAPRYTECRMAPLAMEMVRDIDEDTVDFQANYDGKTQEPVVLPSRFPNLLVNGSAGIAVGMATQIPPHNLREVADGRRSGTSSTPRPTREELLEALMQRDQGPGLPDRRADHGPRGIEDAYRTGRGSIIMRAVVEVEEIQNRQCLVVTELPYQVNPDILAQKIAELVKDGRIAGIADIRDETSGRTGQRLVIVLKRDAVAKVVLNNLYKHTQLQTTSAPTCSRWSTACRARCRSTAFIRHWVDHQIEVIVAAHAATGCARPRSASTSCAACSRRSTRSTRSSP